LTWSKKVKLKRKFSCYIFILKTNTWKDTKAEDRWKYKIMRRLIQCKTRNETIFSNTHQLHTEWITISKRRVLLAFILSRVLLTTIKKERWKRAAAVGSWNKKACELSCLNSITHLPLFCEESKARVSIIS